MAPFSKQLKNMIRIARDFCTSWRSKYFIGVVRPLYLRKCLDVNKFQLDLSKVGKQMLKNRMLMWILHGEIFEPLFTAESATYLFGLLYFIVELGTTKDTHWQIMFL